MAKKILKNNGEYNKWYRLFSKHINSFSKGIQKHYLDRLGLKLSINPNYNFGNKRWLAVYEASSGKIGEGIISIGINLNLLYSKMKSLDIHEDEFNIKAQARITIGHEIGHGIIDFLTDYYDGDNDNVKDFVSDIYNGVYNEEEMVEEFGESMFPEATGVYTSELGEILKDILTEDVYKTKNRSLLTESQESKSISAAKKLLIQKLNYDEQQADDFVRVKLRNDLPVLRTPQGGKFILGATRMFIEGDLRTANDMGNLNSTLKLVASDAHINEYDRNLNGLSCDELVEKFSTAISDNVDIEKEEIGRMGLKDTSEHYNIIPINSFSEASKYSEYTSWCVTHYENMFNSYTNGGINQFYFCLKNGFENVEKTTGQGCPLDEYGLSMIAVSVTENGMLNTCTCRWNHDFEANDSIMNAKELSILFGVNFYNVFKPNSKFNDTVKNALERFGNGEDGEDVFDVFMKDSEGVHVVRLLNKYNFVNNERKLISDKWFTQAYSFKDGMAHVVMTNKHNYIKLDGTFLSKQWFDYIEDFNGRNITSVKHRGKYNVMDIEGHILSPDLWFDACGMFYNGYYTVALGYKKNFFSSKGLLSPDLWFDVCGKFNNGFSSVTLNNKVNVIDTNGKLLSPNLWFDKVSSMNDGFCVVALNGKYNYLNSSGEILYDSQWFDECYSFNCGYGVVGIEGSYNYIGEDGQFLSRKWYDECEDMSENVGVVVLDGKYNYINDEMGILSSEWFDECRYFKCGFGRIRINEKWNLMNNEGNVISEIWFDEVDNFFEDSLITSVSLNSKYNFLKRDGSLLSPKRWFDESYYCFGCDFSYAYIGNQKYDIGKDGSIRKHGTTNENVKRKTHKKLYEGYLPINFEAIPNHIKLYHGTDIVALEEILFGGVISASNGKRHGETRGMNWFSIKPNDNFNRGVLFSITVPKDDFVNGRFNFMNNSEVTSSSSEIKVSNYNLEIVKLGGTDIEGFTFIFNERCNGDIFEFFERIKKFRVFKDIDLATIDHPIIINILKQIIGEEGLKHEGLIECRINEVNASELNLNSFKVRSELNEKLWVNGKLNSRVRLRLLDIVNDFIKELSINVDPDDVLFTGSLANYNWSKYSDIDIHLVYDFKKIYKDIEFVDDYFKTKRDLWNNSHDELKIYGFPIEISVENKTGDRVSSGVYSLNTNKWVVEPDNFDDVKINEKYIKEYSARIMTEIDEIEKSLKKENDNHKIEKDSEKVKKMFDRLKKTRKESLSRSGEMSSGNIIWKLLRRTGYLDKMWEIIDNSYNKINTLK